LNVDGLHVLGFEFQNVVLAELPDVEDDGLWNWGVVL
jgi:hypothetical protein